ncbi:MULTISPECIES: glycoside hydrolase family 25 protein [Gardnerella]|uniref:Glycosyl hydrolase n=1 Tax=Gardnerella greenwoodii TaxID=2914925 RepID=A0A2N6RZK9_9BIFI|nr:MULTISPECIES: glycoside hydrolase family 25 protein [Gardnerella]MDF0753877.1 glycoside hydrolase family 25 protein [Gardnerella greenwoodii]PMC43529.1 glycosyl hydrolase [Gardnerella greenwoodii]
MVVADKHVKNMSGGLVGQIIVRVLAGLASIATAFTMNVVAPKQTSLPTGALKNNVVNPILQPHASGVVRQTSLSENEYGAHWEDSDGSPAFIDGTGDAFVKNAKGVIDVSEHQHLIDWDAVKDSGVDGAIIRISYGWDNGYDKQALRNISECKRLGIPFGIYMYSYAEKPEDGAAEGADIVSLLKGAGVSPEDLTYPVYYDLERWSWSGHQPPTSPYVYQDIVASWWNQLVSAGYHKLGVYSYANYLKGPLNSQYIHERTSWVASYGSRVGFPISTALRGWQYTSNGSVDGIEGRVDLNAFGMADGGEINGVSEFGNTITNTSANSSQDVGDGWKVSKKANRRDLWTNGDKSFILQYELRDSYYGHGGYARLGAPVAQEENLGGGWWRQHCQHGDVITQGRDKKYVIQYELRDSYYKHGGFTRLGAPISDEENLGAGWWRQHCQHGDVFTQGRDKKYVIQYELRDSYYKHGSYSRLGSPISDEENMGGGWWRQHCKHGDVWTHGRDIKYVIQFELLDSYQGHRGAAWLGAPVAEEENMGGGWWRQRCQNGDVWTHGKDKKFVLMFNLRKDYYARGGFEKLGAPVEDEHYDGNGIWRQACQKATLQAK